MTKALSLLLATSLVIGCTASSDDVGISGENDVVGVVEGDLTCPPELVLDLDDYAAEQLPTAQGAEFFAANGQRDGVESTATGLQYKVVQPGMENGVSPVPGDEIFAHYHGFKPNGDVFDSSYRRGEPLMGGATDWIKGWNEALATMKVCEARTLYIPANLAYGDRGRVAGNLVFHMQLLRVNRAGE